jgi:ATP-dependent DNA helicase DinG
VRQFAGACEPGAVRWVDVGSHLRLVESPLDIAQAVQEKLLSHGEEASTRAWIFTSATLGDDERLSWFTEPCGLAQAEVLKVGSPFDYGSQAAVYVPRELPRPNDPAHSGAVADLAARGAARLGGRTMVLTTTLRALRAIGEELQRRFEGSAQIEVLVQGQWPKRRLIERFREGVSQGRPGCLLVASASFWEGIDVPGDALQLVLIDKLPFPPPGDPLVEARAQRLEGQGRSAFNDYFVPEAAVALKQGAGRLIRRESDQGVLAVCDIRLVTMGYGRRLMAALPPMRKLQSREEFEETLDRLAQPAPAPEAAPF